MQTSQSNENRHEISLVTLRGAAMQEFIPTIAKLRIEVFREYPFLYSGDEEYERRYLKKFSTAKDAVLVLALDGSEAIGACTGLPFIYESPELQKPFLHAGQKPEEYFYFGESILQKQYRSRGIGHAFFDCREQHVLQLQRFSSICFCTVIRDFNDRRRPADYRPLAPFWKKRGYVEHPELCCEMSWQEIGQAQESPKKMVFWVKKL